jgi:hypothetical protein
MVQLALSYDVLERPSRRRASRDPQDEAEGCAEAELLLAQLALHPARKHFDRRALFRIGKIEADDLGRLARRRVVEL